MPVDFDTLLHDPILDVFGRDVSYLPVVSDPGAPAFAAPGSFDRKHEIILEEVKGSELDAPGHSTTAPVLTVKRADFAAEPAQGDQVTIGSETFSVWDPQPDGEGMIDLVLRLV